MNGFLRWTGALGPITSFFLAAACSDVLIDPFDEAGGAGATGSEGGSGATTPEGGAGGAGATGGGLEGGGGQSPADRRPLLLVAQSGGVALWDRADHIPGDVLPSATLAGLTNTPRGLARRGDDLVVYTQGDTPVAKIVTFANIGEYAGAGPSAEQSLNTPTLLGPTQLVDFQIDTSGLVFAEHVPLILPFNPDDTMFLQWQSTAGGSEPAWTTSQWSPRFRQLAFSEDDSTIFAGSLLGMQRVKVIRDEGRLEDGGTIGDGAGDIAVARFGHDLFGVTQCHESNGAPACLDPHLHVWRDVGNGETAAGPDLDIAIGHARVPCDLHVDETGVFIAMCSGLSGPQDTPPELLWFPPPSALDASSTAIGSVPLSHEPRQLAVIPADPNVDDAPFTVFIRCDDRLIVAKDFMGQLTVTEEMVNGISTTYDMLLVP